MSGGKRYMCGKCFSTKDYDPKLQYCKKCGWSPIKNQNKLLMEAKKMGTTLPICPNCGKADSLRNIKPAYKKIRWTTEQIKALEDNWLWCVDCNTLVNRKSVIEAHLR